MARRWRTIAAAGGPPKCVLRAAPRGGRGAAPVVHPRGAPPAVRFVARFVARALARALAPRGQGLI